MAGRHTHAAVAQRYGQHDPGMTGTEPDPEARSARGTGAHRAADNEPGTLPGGIVLVERDD